MVICSIWCLKVRENLRERVFENRILIRIFRAKRYENGEWRRSHDEELQSLHRSPNIGRVIKYIKYISRSVFKMLTGKPTGKRLSGMPRRKWEDNMRVYLK